MALKEIYSFNIPKKVTEEVTEDTEQGKLTKEVEVERDFRVIIKKPSRPEAEEADTVYAVEYARCIRLGMLTDAMVEKHYANEGGFLSKEDKDRYSKQYLKFIEIQKEYQYLGTKQKKTKKEKERVLEITEEWVEIEKNLEELQATRNNLFRNTAETKARDKTITWLTLFLTYIQEPNSEPRPFFAGLEEAGKLEYYDKLVDEEDEFNSNVIDKASLYVSLWYMGKLTHPEDFDNFEKLMIGKDITALKLDGETEEVKEEKE